MVMIFRQAGKEPSLCLPERTVHFPCLMALPLSLFTPLHLHSPYCCWFQLHFAQRYFQTLPPAEPCTLLASRLGYKTPHGHSSQAYSALSRPKASSLSFLPYMLAFLWCMHSKLHSHTPESPKPSYLVVICSSLVPWCFCASCLFAKDAYFSCRFPGVEFSSSFLQTCIPTLKVSTVCFVIIPVRIHLYLDSELHKGKKSASLVYFFYLKGFVLMHCWAFLKSQWWWLHSPFIKSYPEPRILPRTVHSWFNLVTSKADLKYSCLRNENSSSEMQWPA